jgi:hypothetical protein
MRIILLALALAGCTTAPKVAPVQPAPLAANSLVSQFYHLVPGAARPTSNSEVEPQYIFAGSEEEAKSFYKQYVSEGYHLIGYTGFVHTADVTPFDVSAPTEEQILNQARRIHAAIALYYTVPQGQQEMNVPLSLGASGWQYASQSVPVIGYYVDFFAK